MTYDPLVRAFLEESNAEVTVRRSYAELYGLPILEGKSAIASGTAMPAKFRTTVDEAAEKKKNPTGSDKSPSPKEETK